MLATDLPDMIWSEAIVLGNWIFNRLPSTRVSYQLPLLLWNANARVDFEKMLTFSAPGYDFIYYAASLQ